MGRGKPFSISVLLGSFKDVKRYLEFGSLGSFFRIKQLETSPLLMLIRSSELFILSKSFSCAGSADVSLANVAKICAAKGVHLIPIQEQVGAG